MFMDLLTRTSVMVSITQVFHGEAVTGFKQDVSPFFVRWGTCWRAATRPGPSLGTFNCNLAKNIKASMCVMLQVHRECPVGQHWTYCIVLKFGSTSQVQSYRNRWVWVSGFRPMQNSSSCCHFDLLIENCISTVWLI